MIHVKRIYLFFSILLTVLICLNSATAQVGNLVSRIVIDPGHGGKDPGALGKSSMEKDIVLNIALKAGKLIKKSFPEVEVLYTRDTDKFIELHKRAKMANENQADLFISIHCNSNPSSKPYGAETYVMGLHKSAENLEVAKTENAAILIEDDYSTQYEGFNPNLDEDYILLSMFQSAYLNQSLQFSANVQDQLTDIAKRRNRGVKQAGFWVLYKTTMPGILIEAGFLSNLEEEKFLLSDDGQNKIANAIYLAFKQYKKDFEDHNKDLKPVAEEEVVVEEKEQPKMPNVVFRVQFASYKKEKARDARKFKNIDKIRVYEHDGYYKYTSGNEKSIADARKIKSVLKNKGFKDVFIVAFADEERITIEQAKKILKIEN